MLLPSNNDKMWQLVPEAMILEPRSNSYDVRLICSHLSMDIRVTSTNYKWVKKIDTKSQRYDEERWRDVFISLL